MDRIETTLLTLRDNPLAGRARAELSDHVRSFPIGNYVVFYRPMSDGIELIRVLNGYRDIQAADLSD